jgi:hypothetical protein
MRHLAGLFFCLLPLSLAARADTIFNFSYISNDLLHEASATMDTIDNGDGTFTAISGSGFYDSYAITLIPNPTAPSASYSPSGYFYYDDLVIPGQDPTITNPGLLFSIQDNGATELNIFSEGPSVYTAYLNNSLNTFGTFAAVQAPEPVTLPFVFVGLALIGMLRLRYRSPAQ